MESVAEGVAHYFVGHHSGVPCSGQAQDFVVTTDGLVDRLHSSEWYSPVRGHHGGGRVDDPELAVRGRGSGVLRPGPAQVQSREPEATLSRNSARPSAVSASANAASGAGAPSGVSEDPLRPELSSATRAVAASLACSARGTSISVASSAMPASTVTLVERPGNGPSPSARPSAAPGLVSTWTNPPWTARRWLVPSACSTVTRHGTTSPTRGVCPSSTVSEPSEVARTIAVAPPATSDCSGVTTSTPNVPSATSRPRPGASWPWPAPTPRRPR